MKYGYARVSTRDQSLDLQTDALKGVGCDEIFTDDGVSGAQDCRDGLDALMGKLGEGDTLVVWKLDRLGRRIAALVEMLAEIGRRKAQFHSITDGFDTETPGGRLMFHMMAAMAQFERELLSERTNAGLAAARERGVKFGPKFKLTFDQIEWAKRVRDEHGYTVAQIARDLDVSRPTIDRALASDFSRGDMLRMAGKVS